MHRRCSDSPPVNSLQGVPPMYLRKLLFPLTVGVVGALALTGDVRSDDKKNPATTPSPRDKGWVKRHEGFVEFAKKGDVDVLFLGDSITDGWRNFNPKNKS